MENNNHDYDLQHLIQTTNDYIKSDCIICGQIMEIYGPQKLFLLFNPLIKSLLLLNKKIDFMYLLDTSDENIKDNIENSLQKIQELQNQIKEQILLITGKKEPAEVMQLIKTQQELKDQIKPEIQLEENELKEKIKENEQLEKEIKTEIKLELNLEKKERKEIKTEATSEMFDTPQPNIDTNKRQRQDDKDPEIHQMFRG